MKNKKIYGVVFVLLVLAFLFVPTTSVFAAKKCNPDQKDPEAEDSCGTKSTCDAETKKCKCPKPSDVELPNITQVIENKYDLQLERNASGQFVVTMQVKDPDSKYCKQTFQILKVNKVKYDNSDDHILSCDHSSVVLSEGITDEDTPTGLTGITVILRAEDVGLNLNLLEDGNQHPCYYDSIKIRLESSKGQAKEYYETKDCPTVASTATGASSTKKIDCESEKWEDMPEGFAREFCRVKSAAYQHENSKTERVSSWVKISTTDPTTCTDPTKCSSVDTVSNEEEKVVYKDSEIGASGTLSDSTINTFKCNYSLGDSSLGDKVLPSVGSMETAKGDAYFTNNQQLYAEHTFVINKGKYQYNVDQGQPAKDGTTISCVMKCSEAVEVEYGPPIATKAGACFEYKVRVTSRVNCEMQQPPALPYPYTKSSRIHIETGYVDKTTHEVVEGTSTETGTGEQTNIEESKVIKDGSASCRYCDPVPECYGYGRSWRQGGPSDEYDSCINTCDGGAYSKKCSQKCYKEVYGSNAVAGAQINAELLELAADKLSKRTTIMSDDDMRDCMSKVQGKYPGVTDELAKCVCVGDEYGDPNEEHLGCYFKTSKGIEWFGVRDTTSRTADCGCSGYSDCKTKCKGIEGRWYTHNPDGKYHNGKYILPAGIQDGFWRHVYSNLDEFPNGYCDDNCWWNDCRSEATLGTLSSLTPRKDSDGNIIPDGGQNNTTAGTIYYNDGYAQMDLIINMRQRDKAIEECEGHAKCSTTQSTYTISAGYRAKNSETINWYKFPYNGQDTIQHTSGTSVVGTFADAKTTIFSDYPSEGQGRLGCYKEGDSSADLYRSTWGFPGSWRNKKTAELSYDPSGKSGKAWVEIKDKYCVPLNSGAVNVEWWNQYFNRYIKQEGITVTSTTNELNECIRQDTTTTITKYYPSSVNTWNIHAETRDFGYFGWNIDVDCFYAINTAPSYKREDEDTKVPRPCGDEYDIRTVDLENMFPGSGEGPKKEGSSTSGESRVAGFNWTKEATVDADRYANPDDPGSGYLSNPEKYLDAVQQEAKNKGTKYYDNDKLDYQFIIGAKGLRALRNRGNQFGSYGDFDDKNFYIDRNGISRYSSDVIRGSYFDQVKAPNPKSKAVQCNNMVNYSSDSCDTAVHGG